MTGLPRQPRLLKDIRHARSLSAAEDPGTVSSTMIRGAKECIFYSRLYKDHHNCIEIVIVHRHLTSVTLLVFDDCKCFPVEPPGQQIPSYHGRILTVMSKSEMQTDKSSAIQSGKQRPDQTVPCPGENMLKDDIAIDPIDL